MSQMPYYCKNSQSPVMLFSVFCQESLTKFCHWVENIDNTLSLFKMAENSLGNGLSEEAVEETNSGKKLANPKVAMALAAGLTAMAPAGAALAEDNSAKVFQVASTTSQQVDCKIMARNYDGTGKEKMRVYSDCRNGVLDAQIAEQEKVIAEQVRILVALNEILSEQQMRIDEQGRILNDLGEELARIVSINGKLIVRRQQAESRITQAA